MKQHIVVNQLAAGMATTRNTKMKLILNSLRLSIQQLYLPQEK